MRRRQPRDSLEETLRNYIQTLDTVLMPRTVFAYETSIDQFLDYLRPTFPQVRRLSQLRRDPHLLGWFRWLCGHDHPLSSTTRQHYLMCLRRLFHDLAGNGHSERLAGLILTEDIPHRPEYFPRPLSPEDDQRLQQELRRTDDIYSHALLVMRATGIRLGECVHLALDCLRPLGHDQWALHVPLGKMHTERLVPVDESVRNSMSRILSLRTQAPAPWLAKSAAWLLPRKGGFWALYRTLRIALRRAAKRAGCAPPVTPHRLRHTFATELLRLSVSLPALMQLMGHKDVRMTLRYVQVTQQDLQREFHTARQNAQGHLVPKLPLPTKPFSASADLPNIRHSLAATRHLLEMYRRHLGDEKTRRKLQRLDKRLLAIAFEIERLTPPEK